MEEFEEAIQFLNVSYELGSLSILKNISGTIYKRKITTLVGPSGAGKTTLLKLCNGLISPTAGKLHINEKSILSFEPTFLRKQVGIVLQNAPIIRGSVFDNLNLPLVLMKKSLSVEDALNYLKIVGLDEDILSRQASDLSGGQKQKLAIARTLINKSEILLLDEITSSLDPVSSKEIEQLILKLNKKYSVTIVWITHNIHQAKEIGDFVWFMKDGQLIESGDKTILNFTNNENIQRFIRGEL
ncbi:phosphate ABC transporter ATP-binding protein [Butyricicoccus sp. 1XD8-22]|nr:phosphate ABC transporter ATP-binding protein [Butyricicoccus sp. 1XD8-22]